MISLSSLVLPFIVLGTEPAPCTILLRLFAVTNEMSEVSLYYVIVLNVLFLWCQPFEIVLHLGIAFLH